MGIHWKFFLVRNSFSQSYNIKSLQRTQNLGTIYCEGNSIKSLKKTPEPVNVSVKYKVFTKV